MHPKSSKTSRGSYEGQDLSISVNIFEIYLVRQSLYICIWQDPADWELLARSALQRLDVDTAIRVYRHLSNISLVWSLESIKGNSRPLVAG